jgi:hypothetical protein
MLRLALLLALPLGGAIKPPTDPCSPRILRDVTNVTHVGDYTLVQSRGAIDLASTACFWVRTTPTGPQFAIASCLVPNGTGGWSNVPHTIGINTDDDLEPVVFNASWTSNGITIAVTTNCLGLGIQNCAQKHQRAVQAIVQLFPKD